jgi:AraC-like DNA-binding protein
MRTFTLTMVMVELCCLFAKILNTHQHEGGWRSQIRVPFAEPAAFARYQARLPRFYFDQPAAQICFPASKLDEPIPTADPVSVQLAIDRCEQDIFGRPDARTFVAQVVGRLVCRDGHYPDIARMAQALRVSERTLKRRLQQEGRTFQSLLDGVRRQDSERLLANPTLAIKQVAEALGYTDPANFARAFAKWTGMSPRAWRSAHGLKD